ncbi:MAG: lipopolysaccharide heptosyltransferase II [Desulfovermiculus sp.]
MNIKNAMLNDPRKILVFCPNWVGDVVMATPAIRCLGRHFPHSSLHAVIRTYAAGVLKNNPLLNDIIACNDKSLSGMRDLLQRIRRIQPDCAILLPNTLRSALLLKTAGVRNIFGYKVNHRSLFLTGGPRPIREGRKIIPRPMTEYYLEICRWLQLTPSEPTRPELFIGKEEQHTADQLLFQYDIKSGDLVVGLNPGAKFGSSKCWPPKYFARLAELLQTQLEAKVLLFVGPGEEGIAQEIMQTSTADIINTGPDRIGLDLLKPMIQRCQLLITNDTGPRHYAVALGVPVVVIMGSTDPRYTASNLEKTVVLQRTDLECVPCHKKTCPHQHECMTSIHPEEVFTAAEKMLHG